jgi:phospholipid-binding lipoprotein MlaA
MISAAVRRLYRLFLLLIVIAILAGCATTRQSTLPEIPPRHTLAEFTGVDQQFAYVYDPWVRFNRSMYNFNYYFDKYLFLPVVHGYEFVTPVFVQHRVSNFYNNIGEIRTLTNTLFQLKGKDSAVTLGRFLTNSTIGLGGLFDPASKIGMQRRYEDFGQTLGYWGAGSGPYLVLPVFGPSSARDAGGLAVDTGITYGIWRFADPFSNSDNDFTISAAVTTLDAIDARHQQNFRYYDSGYPFEYYVVRFLYHEKRELDIGKQSSTAASQSGESIIMP